MNKPLVAIVGRPNVGKSTFFNYLAGRRISIVEDTPGVTRDRIYADVEWLGKEFTLIDTGGIEPFSEDVILKQMRRQAEIAVETSDLILFFVDAREGLTTADYEVANYLRRTRKPVMLVANKVDSFFKINEELYDFYELGLGSPLSISSVQALGIGDLLDEVMAGLPAEAFGEGEGEEQEEGIRFAVVGKPNVGKSSLVNALLKEERAIVSDVPGTTRDALDSSLRLGDKLFTIVDTAGIRRKSRIEPETIERYSVLRAFSAVRRCDVALLMIDALEGVTDQDMKIASLIVQEGKALVLAVNKWDLLEKATGTLEKYLQNLRREMEFVGWAQVLFISAKTGQRVAQVIDVVVSAYESASLRISTGKLNDCLADAISVAPPPSIAGRRLKIYYATQASVRPPRFVLFVNYPKDVQDSYLRYLENYLRKTFDFSGTPIQFAVRSRGEEDRL